MVRYIVIIRNKDNEKLNVIKESLFSLNAQKVKDYFRVSDDTIPDGVTFETHRYDYIYLKLIRLYNKVKFDFTFWIYELCDGTQCSSEMSFEILLKTDKRIVNFYKKKGLIHIENMDKTY